MHSSATWNCFPFSESLGERNVATGHDSVTQGAECRIKISDPVTVTHQGRAVNLTEHADGSISFPTQSGASYRIVPD